MLLVEGCLQLREGNSMNKAFRRTTVAAAVVLSASLVLGTAAGAYAATSAQPGEAVAAKTGIVSALAEPALTAASNASSVKAWQEFRVSGKAESIAAGTKLTLQQKQRSKWVSLPAVAVVNKSGSYSLRVKLGLKGKNQLRIVGGRAVSPVVNVTVR
ncbi:hypothetical protein [Streptomyces sp. NPDC051776]|uniref:hypothetical protein n=1 Tax=Streptomyces sp. NPDC051776 TaxID=3155414 RepID=UPI00342EB7F4